jgi:hypothetical protein
MFTVTQVPENTEARGRKVSFSPDVDDSYRMNVIDKIKGLMDEVDTIHRKEETQLSKCQSSDQFAFKQQQEKELQDFLKRQKADAVRFEHVQVEAKNNLKERQQQETLRLFGTTSSGWNSNGAASWNNSGWNQGQSNQRPSVMNIWNNGGQS